MMLPAPAVRLRRIFKGLEAKAGKDFERSRIKLKRPILIRRVEMRFRGQTKSITVTLPPGELSSETMDWLVEEFRRSYKRIYGPGTAYEEAGIEITTLSLKGMVEIYQPNLTRHPPGGSEPSPALKGRRPVYFEEGSRFIDTEVYQWERLKPGNLLKGPAIVENPATTLVIHPGQEALVDEYMNMVMELM